MKQIIVTRHPALIEYLKKYGYVTNDIEHVTHANVDDVKDKHVFGVLPLWLACHCGKLTEIQLRLPNEKRGKELTLKDLEFFAKTPLKTYTIREVK